MDTKSRTTDEWIALRCQLGEPDAFEDLVQAMERPLFYYALKLVADEAGASDVLQEVWITAFRKIRKLKDPAALRPWLYRITRGISIDRLRQSRSRERAEETLAESFTEAAEPSIDKEDAAAVHQALSQIDFKHREVLVLHFLEDFSVAEIAGVVGCPEGTVKSRIYHAKKALKEALTGGGYGNKR